MCVCFQRIASKSANYLDVWISITNGGVRFYCPYAYAYANVESVTSENWTRQITD